MFIGKNLITLNQVDSTNNYAKLLTANSRPAPDGTVILADSQSGGRGQAGTVWQSEPGKNLTFSILLGCAFLPPPRQFYLSMAVSLGISDALSTLFRAASPSPRPIAIKWPNDVYIGNKKTGGILIENILAGSKMKSSIVGIGLNVNQEQFPGLPQATSLIRELRQSAYPHDNLNLKSILGAVCHAIEVRFLQLKRGEYDRLKSEYLGHLYGFGRKQLFRPGAAAIRAHRESGSGAPQPAGPSDDFFEGIISGISPEGKLLVSTGGGVRVFGMKEIEYR